MAKVAGILQIGKYRVLELESKLDSVDFTEVAVRGVSFPAHAPELKKTGGARRFSCDSVAIEADSREYPDSFFIGCDLEVA